jgi:hypothetical protein
MTRQFSTRSTPQLLKQEARRWLQALRQGDREAHQRLRAAWPAAPEQPVLRDVQHALAREYGQVDWRALCAALETTILEGATFREQVEAVLRHGWDGDRSLAHSIRTRNAGVAHDSICTAAMCGDIDHVRRALVQDPQAALRTEGTLQWTALGYVVYGRLDDHRAVDIAHLLLDAGADPHFRFDDGWGNAFTLITGAIGLGEGAKPSHAQAVELVELLIARDAEAFDTQALYNSSIVQDDPFWTDLLWQRCDPHTRLAMWSRIEPPSLNGPVKVGTLNYLLGNAVTNNHLRRAEWLLEHGAQATTVHSYSGQPVHTVARLAGLRAMTGLLEQHGAAAAPLAGARALQVALMDGDVAAVRTLIIEQPTLLADPALLPAVAVQGNAPATALLIELGADVHALDHEGATVLHRAAYSGSVETVEVVLAAGAEVDRRDARWHDTAMAWACVMGRQQVAQRLASITRDVRALARTARLKRLAAVLADEPALASQHLERAREPTPLFCLPMNDGEAVHVVRLLLQHGAETTVRNTDGRTAEQAARFRGLNAAADLIAGYRRR